MTTISIPVKITVTETVELPKLPYYSERFGMYYAINEAGHIMHVNGCQITTWNENAVYYGDRLTEALQYDQATKEEFDEAYNKAQALFKQFLNPAKGAVTHTMEPNNKQQEEVSNDVQQATEKQNAQESAAQDQAMGVDSEEGTTEG